MIRSRLVSKKGSAHTSRASAGRQHADAGSTAARPVETFDQTKLHWIAADCEYNWDCRCCRFSGKHCRLAAGCNQYSDASLGEIGRQCRKTIVLTLSPTVFDRDVLALDIPGFAQTFAKRGEKICRFAWRPAAQIANYRHRTRSERPSNRRATKNRDEFAPLHVRAPEKTSEA
jgi:hypothetical protein